MDELKPKRPRGRPRIHPPKPKPAPPLPSQRVTLEMAERRAAEGGGGFAEVVADAVARTSERLGPDGNRRRPSQRRSKRGGWMGNPNSIAALELHREGTLFQKGQEPPGAKCKARRRDGSPCRGTAWFGSGLCKHHGGARAREVHWRLNYADYRYSRHRFGRAALLLLFKRGKIPPTLLASQPFREIFERVARGIRWDDPRFGNWPLQHRRQHYERCVELALSFVAAWEAIELRGDYSRWAQVLSVADAEGPWRPRT